MYKEFVPIKHDKNTIQFSLYSHITKWYGGNYLIHHTDVDYKTWQFGTEHFIMFMIKFMVCFSNALTSSRNAF